MQSTPTKRLTEFPRIDGFASMVSNSRYHRIMRRNEPRSSQLKKPITNIWERMRESYPNVVLSHKEGRECTSADLRRVFCFVAEEPDNWEILHNSNVMTKNDDAVLLIDIRDSNGTGCSMVSDKQYPLVENFNERVIPRQETERRNPSNTEDDLEAEAASLIADKKNLNSELTKLDEMCSEIRMLFSLF